MLKKQVTNKIKTKFPYLDRDYHGNSNSLFVALSNLSFIHLFFLILSGLIVIYFANYFAKGNFELLSFVKMKFDDVLKTITTGTITLVSMNMALVNIFLSNLKEERENFENLINKKINNKLMIYFGLTIVICFILLNTFGTDLKYGKENLLIALICLVIIYLLGIAKMYKSIFLFLQKSSKIALLNQEFAVELNHNTYITVFKKSFYQEYKNIFANIKIYEDSSFRLYDSQSYVSIVSRNSQTAYLYDINITKLKDLISTSNIAVTLMPLQLGQIINPSQTLMVFEKHKFPEGVLECFWLSTNEDINLLKPKKEMQEYYMRLLSKRINENDIDGLEAVIEQFESAFETYYNFLKNETI